MDVSDRHVVQIILAGSKWRAKFEVKCKSMSSNSRIRSYEDVGNNCRRDAVLALPSSWRHKVGLKDDADRCAPPS